MTGRTPYSSNPHPQTPQQPPEPSQAQKTNSKAAKPYNHTNNPLPFQNPGSPQKDHPQNQNNTNLRSPHTNHISIHPKLITNPSSTHIRSSSLKSHQRTSEAHLSSHISTHPKLISQVTSTHIRSSSLKPHQHTSEALLSSPTSAHIRSSSLKSHKTVTKTPDINQPVNQSISQPIRPTIFFHNYNPKYSKNKFKYYTKTPHPIQNSLYPQSPHDNPPKNSPHPHPAQRRCHTTSQHTTKKLSPCSHPAQR